MRGHFRRAVGLANELSHELADVQASLNRVCQSLAWAACYGQPNASLVPGEPLGERPQGGLGSFEGVSAVAREGSRRGVVKGKGEITLLQNDLEAEARKEVWKNLFKKRKMNKRLRLELGEA